MPLEERHSAEHARTTFYCHKHKHYIEPRDDDGKALTPAEARRLITPGAESLQPAPDSPPEPELDDTSEDILILLSRQNVEPNAEEIARHLRLHVERIKHYLDLLEDGGYIYAIRVMVPGADITYHLDRKGRDYLLKRKVI